MVMHVLYLIYRSDDEKVLAAENFADSLQAWYWNYGGNCDNDFVIVLAVKELEVRTSFHIFPLRKTTHPNLQVTHNVLDPWPLDHVQNAISCP